MPLQVAQLFVKTSRMDKMHVSCFTWPDKPNDNNAVFTNCL